jgi:hypothetical protein
MLSFSGMLARQVSCFAPSCSHHNVCLCHHPTYRVNACVAIALQLLLQRLSSLLRWALDELDALGDVAAQALVSSLKQLLLVVVCRCNDVVGLLGAVGLLFTFTLAYYLSNQG